jgi:hypothetical protein
MMDDPGSEDDVRQERLACIERARANDSALTAVGIATDWTRTYYRRDVKWNEAELSSLLNALHTNTHVTELCLVGQNERWSPKMRQLFVSMLAANRSITDITLRWCTVNGSMLADGLKQHTMLKELSLYNVKIPIKGMQMMILALIGCPALHSLILEGNVESVPSAMPELVVLLRHSRSLRSLELTNCRLHSAPMRQLTDALSTNKQLRSLNLYTNGLGDDDARCLANMLKKNHTLTTLDVARNESIGKAGWHALADALHVNNVLTTFNFFGTIAAGDVERIEQSLRRNWNAAMDRERPALIRQLQRNDTRSTRIHVSTDTKYESWGGPFECPWEEPQLRSLFNALHHNTHVTTLSLGQQSALESEEVMWQFVDMLAANRSITHIALDGLQVDGSKLARGLEQHSTLQQLAFDFALLSARARCWTLLTDLLFLADVAERTGRR